MPLNSVRRGLALAVGLLGGALAAPPFSLGVPFAPGALSSVSLMDAAGAGAASGLAGAGRLTLQVPPARQVFPAGCQGPGTDLPGLLIGGVAAGQGPSRVVWRPVPAGLNPGLEASAAPGKGAALLFLKRPSSGRVSVDCSQPGGPASGMALDGRFPAGWSRVRVTVKVERQGRSPRLSVRLSPEPGEWRWEQVKGAAAR